MYFWKIDKLNEELIAGELKESNAFKYLFAMTVLYTLGTIQYVNPNYYDYLIGGISLLITIVGMIYIYNCNGGSNGKRIIERYISIGWVVLIRFLILFCIPAIVALVVLEEVLAFELPEESTIVDVYTIMVFEIVYILWIAKHIKFVAKNTNA
jgi:hypothetical protein